MRKRFGLDDLIVAFVLGFTLAMAVAYIMS
jgi:hypothetical protein